MVVSALCRGWTDLHTARFLGGHNALKSTGSVFPYAKGPSSLFFMVFGTQTNPKVL